ncbi:MAG: ATP-binding protein [Candidatus Hadarchaeales archaeon]
MSVATVNLIRTTWFEDVSFWNQPLFYGISPRQFLHLCWIGLLCYSLAGILPGVLRVGIPLVLFLFLGTTFLPRQRIIQREELLLRRLRPFFRGALSRRGGGKSRGQPAPQESGEEAPLFVEILSPRDLSGFLLDPMGRPVAGAEVEILLDGKSIDLVRTGKDGSYSTIFRPSSVGLHEIVIRPKVKGLAEKRIRVEVLPEGAPVPKVPPVRVRKERATPEAPEEGSPEEYIYELIPSNFLFLSVQDQLAKTSAFRAFLNSLEGPIRMHVIQDRTEVELGEQKYETRFCRFFISSPKPLEAQLGAMKVGYRRILQLPPIPKVVSNLRDRVALEGGTQAKVLSISAYPELLKEGFLSELYGVASRIEVQVQVFTPERGRRIFERFYRRVRETIAAERQRRRGAVPEELELKRRAAEELYRRILQGSSKIFRVGVNVTVTGKGKELDEKVKLAKAILEGSFVRTVSPSGIQRELYLGELTAWSIMDSDTIGCLYPFVSADMIETGGLFLGVNLLTGAPVFFNPHLRENQNLLIVGSSGAGKSFSVKILLSRLLERFPTMRAYIIDPEGEYQRALFDLGVEEIEITPRRDMGLDPLVIFSEKAVAADLLLKAFGIDERSEEGVELQELVMRCSSLPELEKRASKKLKKHIRAALRGPVGFLFRGTPARLPSKVCFNLRPLHMIPGTVGERCLRLASFLVFTKIWREVESLPASEPKVVSIDEAWLYLLSDESSAKFLETSVRMARKRGAIIIVSTQSPKDVLDFPGGLSICQNSAVKFLMKQDPSMIDDLAAKLKLSDPQKERLPTLDRGDCLIVGEPTILMHWHCKPEELLKFSTGGTL